MIEAAWYCWDGRVLVPTRPEAAERAFDVGGRYLLATHYERSAGRHRAYFAAINEAWHSLPHDAQDELPSPEHLRKYALIKTGWRNERSIILGSHQEAINVGAFVASMDEYAIVLPQDYRLVVWTARSQSYRAMSKDEFNQSMDDVLDYVAGLIGVSRVELEHEGEVA